MASTKPPIHELEFLKITVNYREFDQKLYKLKFQKPVFNEHAEFIGTGWFHLGDEHLKEAKSMLRLKSVPYRAIFSRSYYAGYSVSKCVRYLTTGVVSLKGDDHSKATDLPGDFPDKEKWAAVIATLYENRLRADYDNWTTTHAEFSETPADAVKSAEQFISEARIYINKKIGSTI